MIINRVPRVGPVQVDAKSIYFIRWFVPELDRNPNIGAQTTLYLGQEVWFASEEPDEIVANINAARANAGLKHLSVLTSSDLFHRFHFDGLHSEGPIHLYPPEIRDGVRSAFKVGLLAPRVHETPNQVAAVIGDGGGRVLPILT